MAGGEGVRLGTVSRSSTGITGGYAPRQRRTRVRGSNRECCPLFTAAFHAKGSTFERAFKMPKASVSYVVAVPARGRGKERVSGRMLVMNHCPFCGAPPSASENPLTEEGFQALVTKREMG